MLGVPLLDRVPIAWVVRALAIATVFSFVIASYTLREQRDLGRESRSELCRVVKETRAVIREILIDSRTAALAQADPIAHGEIRDFYDRQLKRVRDPDCKVIVHQ